MTKYRKRPIIIEATQWHEIGDHPAVELTDGKPTISTLEGPLHVTPGDWIITGVQGENYPCKPDIFASTYEAIHTPSEPTIANLIAAEQARARRLHPHDHAGHPEQANMERLDILLDEVDEVDAEVRNGIRLMLAWDLIQVAGVAAAWAERIMVDNGITFADMLAIIEDGADG